MKTLIIIKIACLIMLLGSYTINVFAQPQDIMLTVGGVTTAKYQTTTNPGGGAPYSPGSEDYTKFTDNNIGSKYLLFNWANTGGIWAKFECTTPAIAGLYTLTSANDAQTRDPKDWTLEGSNDDATWTILDTRTNELFPNRAQRKLYDFNNTVAYKYYRLNITAINGATLFQCAEWRLFTAMPPAEAPVIFKGSPLSGTTIFLEWKDNSLLNTKFVIERSTDNVTYEEIKEVLDGVTTYLDVNLTPNKQYFYRVAATNAHGYTTYSYFSATTLNNTGELFDITNNGGTITSLLPGNGTNESIEKMIDNSINTKYLAFGTTFPYWIKYQSTSTYDEIITSYTITSGNDAADRDMKSWTFQGSNDNTAWTILDTQTNYSFPERRQTKSFLLANGTPGYKYYRLYVTANNGSTNIVGQMMEWEIWGYPKNAPAIPTNIATTTISPSEMQVTWVDNSSNETGFEISHSLDSVAFTVADTVAANLTSYNHEGLNGNTKYYYRVRTLSAVGNSVYSVIKSGVTNTDPNLALPPNGLVATAVSDTEISLTWNDNASNETDYEIVRSLDGTTFTLLTTLAADATSYNDTGLTFATEYHYKVRAINSFGASSYSAIAKAITSGTNQPPTADAIADQTTCNTKDIQTVTVTGLTAGPEAGQGVTLTVNSSNNSLFESLSAGQEVNGQAEISYKIKPGVVGEADVTVTIKDNGGSHNGGTDTFTRMFKISATQLVVTIESDLGETVPRGSTIVLTASGADHYAWYKGPGLLSDTTSATLTVRPTQGYVYKVKATTDSGCEREAQLTITPEGDFRINPVNILTPNNDGKNDTWVIWNIHTFTDNVVNVYDAGGRIVYSQKNYKNDWNGTSSGSPLQGVYFYKIELGSGIPPAVGSLTIIQE
jgi:gliding motility-associated-like protein